MKSKGIRSTSRDRMSLGLTLLSMVAIPGVPLTTHDIAAWCDCSRQRIDQIEKQALRKIRNYLMFREPELWAQLQIELQGSPRK